MKKFIGIATIMAMSIHGHSQCNESVTWTSSKTEYLDSNEVLQNTQIAPITIQTTNNHIKVTTQSDVIEGDITDLSCNWNDPFKEGITSFKSVLAKSNGETRNATVYIKGNDGKIAIIVKLENMNGLQLRIPVDNYNE
jgi:hypothetical protein